MSSTVVDIIWKHLYDGYCKGKWSHRYYLNAKTGWVSLVTEETRKRLQDVYDAVGEDSAETHISPEDDDLLLAHQIEMDDALFLKVPERKLALEVYDDFAKTCDPAYQRLLWSALDMLDFPRFERVLMMEERSGPYPDWLALLEKIAQAELGKWLKHHQLRPRWTQPR